MALSGNQLRAARSLADISQQELADLSQISINTIRKMEGRGAERVRVRLETMERIEYALRESGVEFIRPDDGRAGVRLVEPSVELLHQRRRN